MDGRECLYHILSATEVTWLGVKGTHQALMSTPSASSLREKKVLFGVNWTSKDGSTGWMKTVVTLSISLTLLSPPCSTPSL